MLIAQLSDPHVCARSVLYQGLVDSNRMLVAAIVHLNSLSPAPDVVILSGDVTENGTAEEYAHSREILSAIKQPLIVIPGNHDEREAFRSCFSDMSYLPESGPLHFAISDLGAVRIIGLDVIVPGAHHGEIDDVAIERLATYLAEEPDRPSLIMLHHHPFESGIPFIDAYRCFGAERLETLLSDYPAVERVVCGHVHRFIQRRFA